ncbi:hypothetical protein Sjap_023071 [Stephania japonica]|uniref:Uncharacterized protein n=1 Tax=Stephania japonica TaxID=461633 RepID=A0AAP0HTS3_9MAGN
MKSDKSAPLFSTNGKWAWAFLSNFSSMKNELETSLPYFLAWKMGFRVFLYLDLGPTI